MNSKIDKPQTIKFNESEVDIDKMEQINYEQPLYHPRKLHPQTPGVLRLDEGNQSIVVERLLIELVEYIRSGISGLEESKVLPFLDSLQKSLEEQERQHWTHVLGFLVPEGMKFFQVP